MKFKIACKRIRIAFGQKNVLFWQAGILKGSFKGIAVATRVVQLVKIKPSRKRSTPQQSQVHSLLIRKVDDFQMYIQRKSGFFDHLKYLKPGKNP